MRSIYSIDEVEVCRCQYTDFYGYGFSEQHYFKTICKGAMCYLLFIKGEVAAFASLLAMPIKGRTDCVIFHRIVVKQEWQEMGAGGFLTLFLCGIYRSIGKEVYMKVQSGKMGRWMEHEPQLWKPTAMNRRSRKFTSADRIRNKARYRKAAFSHRYVGRCVIGYDAIARPMAEIREEGYIYKRVAVDVCKVMESVWGIDAGMIRDFHCYPSADVLDRYSNRYDYFTHTETEQCDGIACVLPKGYMELRLRDMDGATESYRRRVAYLNVVFRRLIKRDVTIEHLIYCLMRDNEAYHFGMSVDDVFRICRKVMATDMAVYERLRTKGSTRTYKVNRGEAIARGLSVRQASNMARGEITSERIRTLYDIAKTDEENIHCFAKAGLVITVRTLKRWRKANGLTRYNKQK